MRAGFTDMKKTISGAILAVACLLLLYFSPDTTTMLFVGIMTALVSAGFILGVSRINSFSKGFRTAIAKIEETKKISVSESWLYVKKMDSLFHNKFLDSLFVGYVKKVEASRETPGRLLPDIEDSVNEEYLALRSQRNLLGVIPGSLTGLGILGTFYGLLNGLGGIRFSSVEVVVDSITLLVRGIDTAFYTSIAGVALSLLFEIITRLSWNDMMSGMLDFYESTAR